MTTKATPDPYAPPKEGVTVGDQKEGIAVARVEDQIEELNEGFGWRCSLALRRKDTFDV